MLLLANSVGSAWLLETNLWRMVPVILWDANQRQDDCFGTWDPFPDQVTTPQTEIQIQIRIQIQIVLAPLHHLRDQIHRVAMSDCLVGANLISQRSDYLERLVKKEHKGRFAKMCNLRLRKKEAYSKISTHTLFINVLNALSIHC